MGDVIKSQPRRLRLAVLLAAAAALAGCSVAQSKPVNRPGSGTPFAPSTAAPTSNVVPSSAPPVVAPPQLPRGGRTILPRDRVIAYYGGPNGPSLGVLGSADPDAIAAQIEQRAAQYAPFGRQIQPAMELITTVARPCGSDYPLCTGAIDDSDIQRYLDAAHRHKLLLILDFQPGRGEFLPQVRAVERFLTDPSVSVGLDPEWKLAPDEYPMQVIGSSSAASINAVATYLSGIVRRNNLPDKLLVVHEFRLTMLPDRQNIVTAPGLENVIHADGFGDVDVKLDTYRTLAIPPRFFAGFKLFFTEDHPMMSPAQVMALTPQPDLITYQ